MASVGSVSVSAGRMLASSRTGFVLHTRFPRKHAFTYKLSRRLGPRERWIAMIHCESPSLIIKLPRGFLVAYLAAESNRAGSRTDRVVRKHVARREARLFSWMNCRKIRRAI